jgi:TonB family protein
LWINFLGEGLYAPTLDDCASTGLILRLNPMKAGNLLIAFMAILAAAFLIRLRSTQLTVKASTPPAAERVPVTATPKAASDVVMTNSAQIFNLSDVDQPPVPHFQTTPEYPFETKMLDAGSVTDTFTVDFICDTKGHVQKAHVVISSGSSELDQAAVAGVSKWIFKPGMKDGHPVNVRIEVPINFAPSHS